MRCQDFSPHLRPGAGLHRFAMTNTVLAHRLYCLQQEGLSPTLAAMAENAVLYRKWGTLGGWREFKARVIESVSQYQPEFVPAVTKILNEA